MSYEILRIAVAGGGSWGTAVAHVLAEKGHNVTLVLRDQDLADTINSRHENSKYLAGFKLNLNVKATTDISALAQKNIVVLAIPCQNLRSYLQAVEPYLNVNIALVNTAKGLEVESGMTMKQVVMDVLKHKNPRFAILSGPSFAAEIMQRHPTAVVLGCTDSGLSEDLRDAFSSDYFRCYSSCDVVGVETGGALKNIMAIAAGIGDGLGFGHNSRAALITRGLAEMSRIGVGLGGQAITFMGLSGMGDLMLTCTGNLSRNRQVGLRLGQGEVLEQILDSLGMVAEGVKTTEAVYKMTKKLDVHAPVIHCVYDVLFNGLDPKEGVIRLMTRNLTHEKL